MAGGVLGSMKTPELSRKTVLPARLPRKGCCSGSGGASASIPCEVGAEGRLGDLVSGDGAASVGAGETWLFGIAELGD